MDPIKLALYLAGLFVPSGSVRLGPRLQQEFEKRDDVDLNCGRDHGMWAAPQIYFQNFFSGSQAGMGATHSESDLDRVSTSRSKIAVVVIGRNEEAHLADCLGSVVRWFSSDMASLPELKDGSHTFIYVDSASTDNSRTVAKELGAEVLAVQAERPNAAMGRNLGWSRAEAEYVLFLDGDTVLNPGFPGVARNILDSDPTVAVVWGSNREIHPEHSIFNRVLDLDWIYASGESVLCGGNAMMRRSALSEVGGYDPSLAAGEEPELCGRLRARGYRIMHLDYPMTGHDLNMTSWVQYWKRGVRCGYAYAQVASKYHDNSDPMWALESRANFWKGGFWILSLVSVLVALAWTPWAFAAWIICATAACLRSAWRARWKAPGSPVLLLLYGMHSHLAQVPILFGQVKFYLDRMRSGLQSRAQA